MYVHAVFGVALAFLDLALGFRQVCGRPQLLVPSSGGLAFSEPCASWWFAYGTYARRVAGVCLPKGAPGSGVVVGPATLCKNEMVCRVDSSAIPACDKAPLSICGGGSRLKSNPWSWRGKTPVKFGETCAWASRDNSTLGRCRSIAADTHILYTGEDGPLCEAPLQCLGYIDESCEDDPDVHGDCCSPDDDAIFLPGYSSNAPLGFTAWAVPKE